MVLNMWLKNRDYCLKTQAKFKEQPSSTSKIEININILNIN